MQFCNFLLRVTLYILANKLKITIYSETDFRKKAVKLMILNTLKLI